jgi:hypothetical protein
MRRARVTAADFLACAMPARATRSTYYVFATARDAAARSAAHVLALSQNVAAALPYADAAQLLDELAARSHSWRSR